jgi:hypothetical protein
MIYKTPNGSILVGASLLYLSLSYDVNSLLIRKSRAAEGFLVFP